MCPSKTTTVSVFFNWIWCRYYVCKCIDDWKESLLGYKVESCDLQHSTIHSWWTTTREFFLQRQPVWKTSSLPASNFIDHGALKLYEFYHVIRSYSWDLQVVHSHGIHGILTLILTLFLLNHDSYTSGVRGRFFFTSEASWVP